MTIAPAVAKAAMRTGVATRPIGNLKSYRDQLTAFVYRSGTVMQPIIARAIEKKKRIVFAEGDDERVLRAAQIVVDERIARPILVGHAGALDGTDVHEHILAAVFRLDETKAFLAVEPLHGSLSHLRCLLSI